MCIRDRSGAIRGCGDAVKPMIITGTGVCLLRVVWLLALLPLRHQLSTILVSYPISWVLTTVLFFIYYKRGRFLRPRSPVPAELAREQSGDEVSV